MKRIALILATLIVLTIPAGAVVIPHRLFSDGAVLQQGMEVPVWGMAKDGETVTVEFQGQRVCTVAAANLWMVRLDPLKAGGPFEMRIAGEENTVTLRNILVGEVWIASGQSNMQWPLNATDGSKEAIAASADPMLHLFSVQRTAALTPRRDFVGNPISYEDKVAAGDAGYKGRPTWVESGPETVPDFTAIGYYFGKEIRKDLNVPVGIIHTSWGGTRAEAWTSGYALNELIKSDPPHFQRWIDKPGNLYDPNRVSALYNAMISPLVPFAFRGVIWYQGESNAAFAWQYRTLFPAMIENWRDDWGQGDFPFLFVQIAPWQKIQTEPQESSWAELRETQLYTAQTVPNTAMIVITDHGDPVDIHPRAKEPVGHRLALAARAKVYGEKVAYSGPVYKSMKIAGDRAVLSFDFVEGGLVAKGGGLTGFTIAGEDRKFVNAQAKIEGDKVVVWSTEVQKPAAVRFGWADCPVVNLFNKADLPATPFRTDDFPMVTGPKD